MTKKNKQLMTDEAIADLLRYLSQTNKLRIIEHRVSALGYGYQVRIKQPVKKTGMYMISTFFDCADWVLSHFYWYDHSKEIELQFRMKE